MFVSKSVRNKEKSEQMVAVDTVKQLVTEEVNKSNNNTTQGSIVSDTVKEMSEREKGKNNAIL